MASLLWCVTVISDTLVATYSWWIITAPLLPYSTESHLQHYSEYCHPYHICTSAHSKCCALNFGLCWMLATFLCVLREGTVCWEKNRLCPHSTCLFQMKSWLVKALLFLSETWTLFYDFTVCPWPSVFPVGITLSAALAMWLERATACLGVGWSWWLVLLFLWRR